MNLIISCFLLGLATAAPPAYLEKDVKGPYVELITNNNLRINTGGKQSCYNINPSNIAKLNFITSEYGILYYSNIDCESHSRLLDGSAPQAVDGPVPAEIAKTLVKSVRLVSVAAKVNGSPNISSDGDSYFIQSYIPEYKQSADSNVPANVASYVNDQANVAAYQSPTDLKVQLMVGNNEKVDFNTQSGSCVNMKDNQPVRLHEIEQLSKGYGILFYSALNCAHHSRMLDGSKPQSWTGKVQYEFAFNDIASFRLVALDSIEGGKAEKVVEDKKVAAIKSSNPSVAGYNMKYVGPSEFEDNNANYNQQAVSNNGPHVQLLVGDNQKVNFGGQEGCFNFQDNKSLKLHEIEELSKGYGVLFYSSVDCAHGSRMLDGVAPQSWVGKVPYEFVYNDVASIRLVAVDSTDKKSSVVVDTKNIATNNKATSNSYQSASIDPIKSKNILQLLTSNNVRLDYDGLVGCFNMKNNSPAKIQQIESIPKGLGILFYSALDCETHSRLLDGAAPQTWAGKLPYEFVYNDVASFRLMKAEPPVTPVANYQNVQRAIDSRIPLRKARIFSPWIDMSIQEVTDTPGGTKPYDVVGVVKANNLSYVNLAFIVGDSVNKKPVWGGGESLESKKAVIEELKAMGVQVTISFGGEHAGGPAAKSTELANVITNATELQAAYQSVIDFYQIPSVDFDIEGAKFDQAAVDRRSIAIAGIQKANPKLRISATLEVFVEKGLSTLGTAVVTSAKNVSVQFDTINIMTMNYGSSNVPDGANGMWKYVLTSITGAATQLNSLNYNAGLGVTAMIGFNSDGVALFNQEDAVNLLKFANAADPIVNINYLGFWTLNRDINIPKGNNSVNWDASVSSGIVQTKYEFTNIFKEFEKAPQFVTFTTTTAKPTATGRPSGSTSSSLSLDFDYFLFISLFIFNYV